jgi:hypothetical protein
MRNQTLWLLIGSTTSPRTSVEANTVLGWCRLRADSHERSIELLNANGIANNHSGASVENRFGLSNHFTRISIHRDSDLIEGCLPVTLSRKSTH